MVRAWARLLVMGLMCCAVGCGSDSGGSDQGGLADDDDPRAQRDAGARDSSTKDAGRDAARQDAKPNDPKPNPVDPQAGTCAAITKEAPVQRGAVDVIWVVDNSLSMLDKVLQVQANLANFFAEVEASGADAHIVTITGVNLAAGTALENDANKHRFLFLPVQSSLVYSPALDLFDQYRDFLRPDASTHVVVVTDDNDILSGPDFVREMETRLGHPFTVHAIVSEQALCSPLGGVGTNYMSAADQTGGQTIDVCSQDWTQVFGTLISAVVAAVPLPCSYDMAEAATTTEDYDPEEVAVSYTPAEAGSKQELPKTTSVDKCTDQPGWYYDDEAKPTKLELCPAACELVKAGGKMAIAFGCKPTTYL